MSSLSPSAFYTLLALSEEEQHGYAIMQAAKSLSDGSFSMGPATLYTTIGKLLKEGLIEETTSRKKPEQLERGRRYYRLSGLGRSAVEEELRRMEGILKRARLRKLRTAE
jgi:DNA-binding PadR family transcriptional regulator